MTTEGNEHRARRIVVVFGGGGSDTNVAGVLASLASEGAADIAAVFLEDHRSFRGMRRTAPAVLIVSAGKAGFEASSIDALQRQLSCPIALVRD